MPWKRRLCTVRQFLAVVVVLACMASAARGESCQASSDMDDATRATITAAGQGYFEMVAKNDVGSLRQNAIGSLAGDFSGVEATVKESQAKLSGAQSAARPPFLLDAEGVAPLERAEFLCGLFTAKGQSPTSAVFILNNLPAGKYAIVMFDASSAKASTVVSFVLQLVGNDWKLGGLYVKPRQLAGHDSDWFVTRAREYKTKGQARNAWFYYRAAINLITPLPFMSTRANETLDDESRAVVPGDLPVDGKTAELPAGTTIYRLTDLSIDGVGNDVDLVVRYQSSDVSNTSQTYQNNLNVIKALLVKFPEFRGGFGGIVARAVDSNGHDYGTLMAMKDIK